MEVKILPQAELFHTVFSSFGERFTCELKKLHFDLQMTIMRRQKNYLICELQFKK